eukprot:SAG22_NODE_12420_length_443_cov_1.197674_1_plen_78_part_00
MRVAADISQLGPILDLVSQPDRAVFWKKYNVELAAAKEAGAKARLQLEAELEAAASAADWQVEQTVDNRSAQLHVRQ